MPKSKSPILSSADNLSRAIGAIETLRKCGAKNAYVTIGDIQVSGTFGEPQPMSIEVKKFSREELDNIAAKELEAVTYGSA